MAAVCYAGRGGTLVDRSRSRIIGSNISTTSTQTSFKFLRIFTIFLPLCWYGIVNVDINCSSSICMEIYDVDPVSFSPIFTSSMLYYTPSTFTWSKFYSTKYVLFSFLSFDKTLALTHRKTRSRPVGRRRASLRFRMDILASGCSWLIYLLLLAGDVELNPGPCSLRYPCGVCGKAVRNNDRAVACDTCNIWYHTNCMVMNPHVFESLRDSDISWTCFSCGIPNFSSKLFESSSYSNLSDHNSFEPLNSTGCFECKSPTNNFNPNNHSTPKNKSKRKPKLKPKVGITEHPKKTTSCNTFGNLKCFIVNFQSLFNKKEEFSQMIKEKNVDIVIGTETWLTPEIKNSELLLDNFDVYRRDRSDKKGGGVMVCVKKELNSSIEAVSSVSESIFVRINFKTNKPLIIGSVYRPTNNCRETCNSICADISNVISKNKKAIYFIGGDFNLPDINWQEEKIVGRQYPIDLNETFLETSQDLGLSQIISKSTRGNSILDLLFTNTPFLFSKEKIIPGPGKGDHHIVCLDTILKPPRKKPLKLKIQLWKATNIFNLKRDALNFNHQFLKSHNEKTNVEILWKSIKENLNLLMEDNVPNKISSSKNHQPWITTKTKQLLRRKHRLFKKARQHNSERLWKKYKATKKECQKECRRAHSNFVNAMFLDDFQNKKLWSYIKSKRQEKCGISDLRNDQNDLIQDPLDKANLLNNQFSSVFSNPTPKIKPSFPKNSQLPEMEKIVVTNSGVLKLLLNIKENKATGPDGIPGKILKTCANELTGVFRLLFQASLDQGIVPDDWKHANVVPLFKKGAKTEASNYRPVSLTSISCKLLEHIIFSNIMDHFDHHNFLNDSQHGFRHRRSCETQLINTINDFSNCLNERGQIDAILLDFSKAFDKVDHNGLMLKLKNAGLSENLLNWSHSFLFHRSQRVVVEGTMSASQPVLSGVPQGTVLGPLFFLIYINDISFNLSPGTKIRLFADDSLLYRKINSYQDN